MLLQTMLAIDTSVFEGVTALTLIELLVKILLVIGMFFYLVFAIVIVRQIKLMRTTLITSFAPYVTILGLVHLVIAVSVALFFTLLL